MVAKKSVSIIREIENYFLSYLAMPADYAFAGALWAAMTYIYHDLDVLPYLVITALTKRSGKTLFGMDLLRPVCSLPEDISGMTASVLYRTLGETQGSIFADEAEAASSESAGMLRTALNIGYKRGQTIKRTAKGGDGIDEFPVFSPKCFILIGDVNDTLRDRSIIFRMRRGTPEEMRSKKRYMSTIAEVEAADLGARLKEAMDTHKKEIMEAYRTYPTLDFLPSRDAEIWHSLFAICSVLEPSRIRELERVATDIATEKTQDAISYSADEMKAAEDAADRTEFGERLLRDMVSIFPKGSKVLSTEDALTLLCEIPTAPWRRYKGTGLNAHHVSKLMDAVNVHPRVVRVSKQWRDGSKGSTKRGYVLADLQAAVKKLG